MYVKSKWRNVKWYIQEWRRGVNENNGNPNCQDLQCDLSSVFMTPHPSPKPHPSKRCVSRERLLQASAPRSASPGPDRGYPFDPSPFLLMRESSSSSLASRDLLTSAAQVHPGKKKTKKALRTDAGSGGGVWILLLTQSAVRRRM